MPSLFGCYAQTPRSCDDCFDGELNRIIHVAFVRKGVSVNKSTSALFASSILAAELAGNAFIIRNTNGTKAAPTVKEGKGAGKQQVRIVGKEHSIDVIDVNYVNNVNFWNDFENNAQNYNLYYFTNTMGWETGLTAISAAAMDPITDDNSTEMEGSFQVKWTQKGNPVPYPCDVDEFADCAILFTYEGSGGFYARSGNTATLVGTEFEGSTSDTFNFGLDTGYDLALVEVKEGALPTGLTLDYSGQAILLTGTATIAGSYTAVIRASNSTGVSGEFEVTFVIS